MAVVVRWPMIQRGSRGLLSDDPEIGRGGMDDVTSVLPRARVPRLPRLQGLEGSDAAGSPLLAAVAWQRAVPLGPLVLADGSAAAEQATTVRVLWDRRALYLRFECADRDAWGTLRQRNDPIYQEEAVEVFLAPGGEAPRHYWEIEVSPLGVIFAAAIANPTGRRADLIADTSWECTGLATRVGAMGANQDWWAEIAIPFAALTSSGTPRRWRANFYRIERPRGGRAELSCWSPTFTTPADFHRPQRFGHLVLG
jgi:hypothetical protein